MRAFVVYESLWGNTKAVAEAVASGIGDGAEALSTAEATAEKLQDADLLVAGAPLLGFSLPTDDIRRSIEASPSHRDNPPDMSHPSARSWLESLPKAAGLGTGFETRIWWSPGSSAKRIAKALASAGYKQIAKPERFVVEGTYGPLRAGELERAEAWGSELAQAAKSRY